MNSSLLAFFAIFLFSIPLAAQLPVTDTLQQARILRSKGKLRQTEYLLNAWCAVHPGDGSAFWLRAQNEFWRKHFGASRRFYRRAISNDPENLYLKLDFAETLLDMGSLQQGRKNLVKTPINLRKDPHYQFIEAKYHFWSGAPKMAQKIAEAAQKSGSVNAPELYKEIKQARAPWLRLAGNYTTDSQPLQSYESTIDAGVFYSKLLDLQAHATFERFLKDSAHIDATGIELTNRVHLPKSGTQIRATAGVFALRKRQPDWVAGIEISQNMPMGLNLHLTAAKTPYLHTRASLDTSIYSRQYSAQLDWHEAHGFLARAGVQTEVFEDNNQVNGIWAWVMSPALNIWRIEARIGYSYSFSDSRESRFTTEKSLGQILNPWDSTAQIMGIYSPYFTPINMKTQSAIASITFDFSKNIALIIDGKYGFLATALNPYLFLDSNANNTVYIRQEFQKTDFTPLEAGAKLKVMISSRVGLEASYRFSRNLFYEIQVAGIAMKLTL